VNGRLVNRLTKTFTANASIVNRLTKTFTSNARLVNRLTKTFTSNARLVSRLTKTFTANARVVARNTVTFTADCIITPPTSKFYNAFLSGHNQLMDLNKENVRLIRETKTVDGFGAGTAVTETEDTIEVHIYDIMTKDRDLIPPGESSIGWAKMITDEEYDLTNLGDNIIVEVGDIIQRSTTVGVNEQFRVEQRIDRAIQGNVVFREFLIRRLNA